MTQYKIYKHIAKADYEPDNYYEYACRNGKSEMIWIYSDLKDALTALSGHETTCERMIGNETYYQIICYSLEKEEDF